MGVNIIPTENCFLNHKLKTHIEEDNSGTEIKKQEGKVTTLFLIHLVS